MHGRILAAAYELVAARCRMDGRGWASSESDADDEHSSEDGSSSSASVVGGSDDGVDSERTDEEEDGEQTNEEEDGEETMEEEDGEQANKEDGELAAVPGAHQTPAASRGADGAFKAGLRQRRKRQAPNFSVIEKDFLEPSSCGAPSNQSGTCETLLRCAAHGGTQCQQWRIRGPVLGWSDDAINLNTVITVRAVSTMSAGEVYVRSLPQLVPSAYVASTAAYESVRFVVRQLREQGEDTSRGSFAAVASDGEMSDGGIKRVLKRAAAAQRGARNKLKKGHVSLVRRTDALSDPVYKAAVRGLLRKRSIGAVSDYRKKGAALLRERTAQLRGLLGVGAVHRVRRYLELKDGSAGSRAMRLRVSRGLSQMHLLPSRTQLRKIRREEMDAPGRVGHYFLTKSATGGLLRWDYVAGSASAGIRRYRTACGVEKRLRAHSNKYWDARRRKRQSDDESEVEDDGVYFDNTNVELNGCYAPEELDPVLIAELVVSAQSFLEDDDGTSELLILAVGYDVAAALQQAVDKKAVAGLTTADVANGPAAVLTFAADGGKVRRRDLTAYTVSASSPFVVSGRTALTTLLYAFASEKRVDRTVTRWVRDQATALLSKTLSVPVVDPAPTDAVQPPETSGLFAEGAGVEAGGSSRHHPLPWSATIQVCGMLLRHGLVEKGCLAWGGE